uniref:Uncharacterized protein n=1 Tax=Stegastes partitus TaxID=144197 RepID=A0A3B4ZSD3_9TELE
MENDLRTGLSVWAIVAIVCNSVVGILILVLFVILYKASFCTEVINVEHIDHNSDPHPVVCQLQACNPYLGNHNPASL